MEAEDTMRKRKREADDAYYRGLSPGYGFSPYAEELVRDYLKPKLYNLPLPRNQIIDINLSLYNPEVLAETYKQYGEKELYVFTPTKRKYPNGTRPDRSAGDGFWKATGGNKEIKDTGNGTIIGFKKTLVFYRGKPPKKGEKTNWIMQEYRLNNPPPRIRRTKDDMTLDEWVLCKIYKKVYANKSEKAEEEYFEDVEEDEDEVSRQEDEFTTSFPFNSNGALQQSPFPPSLPCNSSGSPKQFRWIEQPPLLQLPSFTVNEFTTPLPCNSNGAALQQHIEHFSTSLARNSIGAPQPPTLQLPPSYVNRIYKSETYIQKDVEKEVISAAPLPCNSNNGALQQSQPIEPIFIDDGSGGVIYLSDEGGVFNEPFLQGYTVPTTNNPPHTNGALQNEKGPPL